MALPIGEAFSDAGAVCIFPVGENMTVYTSDEPSLVGKNVLRYICVDENNGLSSTGLRNVVLFDNEPPKITLNGPATKSIVQYDVYEDPGAEAVDNVDGTVRVGTLK